MYVCAFNSNSSSSTYRLCKLKKRCDRFSVSSSSSYAFFVSSRQHPHQSSTIDNSVRRKRGVHIGRVEEVKMESKRIQSQVFFCLGYQIEKTNPKRGRGPLPFEFHFHLSLLLYKSNALFFRCFITPVKFFYTTLTYR